MGRMNVAVIRYMEQEHFRVLIAVEMGMRNHELVPLELIGSIARVHRGGVVRTLTDLVKHGTVAHERGKRYDGYRLTTLGYDILALKALNARQVVGAVGNQIGVGKESDVFVGGDPKLNDLVLKFHRLGRTSFRKLKEKRDYHKKRKSCSWLYLSSLAAAKEFAFLKALYGHNFPLPKPIDRCRHVVVMDLIIGTTLCNMQQVNDAEELYEKLMNIIMRLARYGLIHGDFNEFNIMLTEEEEPILIDLPQMISIDHPNAQFYFERDVDCERNDPETLIRILRFNYESEIYPKFEAVTRKYNLDVEVNASGFTPRMSKAYNMAVEKVQRDDDSSTATSSAESSGSQTNDNESSENMSDEDGSAEESSSESNINESNKNMLNNGSNNRLKEWIKSAQDELEKLNVNGCQLLESYSYSTDEKRVTTSDKNDSKPNNESCSKPKSSLLHKEQIEAPLENEIITRSVFSEFSLGSIIAPEVVRKRVAAEMKAKQKKPIRVKGKANALVRLKKTNAKIIKEWLLMSADFVEFFELCTVYGFLWTNFCIRHNFVRKAMEKGSKSSTISILDNAEFKLEAFILPNCYCGDLKSVLIPKGLISDRIKCLSREIFYAIGDKPLVILCILKGSFRFFTELVEELTHARISCSYPMEVEFIRVKSYTNSERSETLEIIGLLNAKQLEDKNVVIVEDIVDSGVTMSYLLKTLEEMGVKKKWTAVLLSKRCRREVKVQEDFVAFDIPDKFVVGFGLDYNQKFRDLEHICVMSEAGIEKYKVAD
ncbi:unnamed protein product [Litomosoides sigmodontis]|uniref:Serine/threonine-protein kinase RIO2 n=1 Tax=Litomosoides sigmodontis TaxID=42156 RepID=A0A3P6UF58_LITSI|nr:unnamed protein product [Litomosoides sigmodontis]